MMHSVVLEGKNRKLILTIANLRYPAKQVNSLLVSR